MAAPDLTKRSACFVAKIGTDDAGYNPVGAPQARLTIAAALADLAANYPTASATAPQVVSLEPGTYTTPAFALPPFTWIIGNPDGPTDPTQAVIVSLTGNVTLSTGWQTNQTATGGFIGLTIRQSTSQTIDLTMPTPAAGNPQRVITLRDIRTDCDSVVWQGTSTADTINVEQFIHDGNTGDAIGFTSGTINLKNFVSAATVTITSGAALAATVTAVSSSIAVLILTKGVSALTASFDAVSTPIRSLVTLNGGATFSRSNDANGDAYTPATPANWGTVPTTVQEGLDNLAAGGGPGNFVYIVRTGNRSSAAWGTAGVAINDTLNTFTDSSSVAGPVATVVARSFGIPTFTSAVAVVYANAANIYIAGDPVAGGAATLTAAYALWNAGKTRVDGGIYFGGTTPGSINGTNGAVTITTAGTNQSITFTVVGTGNTIFGGANNGWFNADSISSASDTRIGLRNAGAPTTLAGLRFIINSGTQTAIESGTFDAAGNFGSTKDLVLNSNGGSGGAILVGTVSNSSNGRIQLATGTTSATGIGFGPATCIFTSSAGVMALDHATASAYAFTNAGVQRAYMGAFTTGTQLRLGTSIAGHSVVINSGNDTTAITITSAQKIVCADDLTAGTGSYLGWAGTKSLMTSPSDGVIVLSNNAANSFTRLCLGGTASTFPAIKRSSAAVAFRLADDSADAVITAASGTFSGPVVHPGYAVASLPAAASYQYGLAFVTDATLTAITGLGLAPTGGGANKVPVYSDGTNWLML